MTPTVPTPRPTASAAGRGDGVAARDCFNWGYDPFHFNAPEGSYASDAADGAARIREFRAMVQALHARRPARGHGRGLQPHHAPRARRRASVLDRIVPGYYHRLDANGAVERSTCCDNTATEHAMMAQADDRFGRAVGDAVPASIRSAST